LRYGTPLWDPDRRPIRKARNQLRPPCMALGTPAALHLVPYLARQDCACAWSQAAWCLATASAFCRLPKADAGETSLPQRDRLCAVFARFALEWTKQ